MNSKHDVKKPHKFLSEAFLRQFDVLEESQTNNILQKIKPFCVFTQLFTTLARYKLQDREGALKSYPTKQLAAQ